MQKLQYALLHYTADQQQAASCTDYKHICYEWTACENRQLHRSWNGIEATTVAIMAGMEIPQERFQFQWQISCCGHSAIQTRVEQPHDRIFTII